MLSHLIQEEPGTQLLVAPHPAADPGPWLLFKSAAEVSMEL